MSEEIYHNLAKVLDTLPNGFPTTDSGVEIKLLKKIFRPEDAELFCDLRLDFETAQQISERTERALEGLEEHLSDMRERGQIFGVDLGGVKIFKMVPWAFGIYEFQRPHMDRELAEMCEDFGKVYGEQFFKKKPQLMQVIPIEKEIPNKQQALSYEQVSNIIENSQSFAVFDCICKKEKGDCWTMVVISHWKSARLMLQFLVFSMMQIVTVQSQKPMPMQYLIKLRKPD